MWKPLNSVLLLLYFVAVQYGSAQTQVPNVIYIEENTPIRMVLPGDRPLILRVEGLVDRAVSFVLLQVHTHNTEFNLSLTSTWTHGYSTRGKDVGAVATVDVRQTYVQFFVNATQTANAIIMATAYLSKSPVPGGCNMEFPLRLDPNIKVNVENDEVSMKFEYANFGTDKGAQVPTCEVAAKQTRLTYDVYQYFLPSRDFSEETYLNAMKVLIRGDELRQETAKVKTLKYRKDQTHVRFAAYPGQGMVFGVIVNELDMNNNTLAAAYVPVSTYTCNFTQDNQCSDLNDLPMEIMSCILAAFGLILCVAGHRFFKFSMFTFGMLAFGLVAYILIARLADLPYEYTLIWACLCGLVGGALWLLLWCLLGVPVLSVLLAGLVMGFTTSSVIFNLTPLGLIDTFTSDFNYGMAFACGVLILPVILLAFTKKLSLLSCTMVGSYLVITAIDSFLHSSTAYIVLNSIRKGSILKYVQVLATLPLQLTGILLLIGWGVLVLLGLIIQSFTERDQPDFPACPYDRYKERQQRRRQMEELAGSRNIDNERRPLLSQPPRRFSYGRSANVQRFQETPPRNSPPPSYGVVDPL